MGYLHESDGLIALHDYGDICPIHNVFCDDQEYQTEDGGGYPVYVCVGYVCPVCRAEAEKLIAVEPPTVDVEIPF